MTTQSLAISFNPRIHDKPSAWREEYADNWRSSETDLAGLLEAIRQGHAFIAAAMSSPHRSSAAFVHADLAVVDIDHGLDLEGFRELELSRHACLVYTSSSHQAESGKHRFRVLFRLPRRISDPDHYKAIVTALIRALGGDKSCSDPCRIFYGNSRCQHWLGASDACLSEHFIEEARKEWLRQQSRHQGRSDDYDDTSIGQAIYVLGDVLEPTADGERDRFVRITAAAASAGDALFPAWSDWASRGHHGSGKNRKQTSERFFRGFSGRSSLGTLFYLASEQDPNWRDGLPDALRSSGYGDSKLPPGYRHDDFMGYDDPEYDLPKPGKLRTPSIIEWAEAQRQQEQAAESAQPVTGIPVTASAPQPEIPVTEPHLDPDKLAEPDDEEIDPEFMGDPYDYPPPMADGAPMPPEPKRRGRKPKAAGSSGGSEVARIRNLVKGLYPDLRLNRLTQALECGPMDNPKVVENPDKTYLIISENEDRPFAKTHVYDAIQLIAYRHSYNPVHRFLDECAEAEPVDYFDTLASTLLGVHEEGPKNPRLPCGNLLADVVLKRFLIAAVARARKPGCPLGWMPILVGPQNVGKTNFFQYLTPHDPLSDTYPWCPTIQQGISYLKERPHALHQGWIVNLDEVERFFRRQYTEEFKNLVTVAVDRSRRLYENERAFERSFVLVGCTNSDGFLVDPTGNRRFMAITVLGKVPSAQDPDVKIIDLDRVKADRRGIWAAAQQAYANEPVYEFSSYEIRCIEDYLNGYTEDSPLTGALQDVLSRNVSLTYKGRPAYRMTDIFAWLGLDIDPRRSGRNGVTDELRRLGYASDNVRHGGKMVRIWQLAMPRQAPEGPGFPWDWSSDAA